ncbi:hypothetical protein EXN66_Car017828 [Channa argus]|uniref:Uncharacterized protein n=1 Tax=Channa argus TaxID=215402 RepID=A0A6G1QHG3_CHAAH|nr:hypothetical protein EXN66_Car017828 [Channa argus]
MSKYILLYNHYNNSVQYILNQNALIDYQEDIRLKQSVDQEQCNSSVCMCVCVSVHLCAQTHMHTHAQRKECVQQLVRLTLPQQSKYDPGLFLLLC